VRDDGSPQLSDSRTFTVVVLRPNTAPVLPAQNNLKIDELSLLQVVNGATDAESQPSELSYQLLNPAPGMTISASGLITWTPTEAQGPSTNTITTVVTDSGSPPMSATNSFSVIVNELNTPPSFAPIGQRVVKQGASLAFTVAATDADLPPQALSYTLEGAVPEGATLNATTGAFFWAPNASQTPSTNSLTLRVTDNGPVPLSFAETFTVIVTQTNAPAPLTLQFSSSPAGPFSDDPSAVIDLNERTVRVPFSAAPRFYRLSNSEATRITEIRVSGNEVLLRWK